MKLSAAALANEPVRELLQQFPFLTKAVIMSRQRDFLDERLNPRFLNYATSGGSSGQGIGLTLVQEILTAHGFDFSLGTAEGGGAEFRVGF